MDTNNSVMIIANWKLNPKKFEQADALFSEYKKAFKKYTNTQIIVCPSAIHLPLLAKKQTNALPVGSQDSFWEDIGSYTGSISPLHLKDLGVMYALVGHSEQRLLGQTNQDIARKINALVKKGITPILCIGEKDRAGDASFIAELETQIQESLEGVPKTKLSKIVIAYEPLWAIGLDAKRPATAQEVEEVCIVIRRVLSDMYALKKIPDTPILYGGSVSKKTDIETMLEHTSLSGFLVGRASLSVKKFEPLVQTAHDVIANRQG
jgi:triosephosphate isomerase